MNASAVAQAPPQAAQGKRRRGLPPGPQAGRLRQAAAFHRDPLGVLREAQRRFGDVFTLRLGTAGPVVVVADPDLVETVAVSDAEHAHAGEARRRVLPVASPASVFGGDGETHRLARSRIEAAFQPQAVVEHAAAIRETTQRHMACWPLRRPVRLLARMRLIADEVFVRQVLGVEDDERARRLARAIGEMLWTPGNPPLTIPAAHQGLLGRAVKALYERRRRPVAQLISSELDARRSAGRAGGGVLGLLLDAEAQQGDEAVVDELLAVLMAAQEPMAAALTWITLCAAGSRETARRLADEGVDGAFGRTVVAESLRLHPSAVGVLRRYVQPVRFAGFELQPPVTVMLPIPLLQRDSRRFEAPDEFWPERQLDERAREGMLPFGGGARRCLGEALARLEIANVLGPLFARLRVRPLMPGGERMVLRATILVPHRSGMVIAGQR